MATYISLIRGINVGGKNSISMAELTRIYRETGCTNVTPYIQSGNVIFDAEASAGIAAKIEQNILSACGIDIRVFIRTPDELRNSAEANPFVAAPDFDPKKLHVTFLADVPAPENIRKTDGINYPPDRFKLVGKEIFVHCPDGYGRTKLTNTFFEKTLKTAATTRNWNTVHALLELAGTFRAGG